MLWKFLSVASSPLPAVLMTEQTSDVTLSVHMVASLDITLRAGITHLSVKSTDFGMEMYLTVNVSVSVITCLHIGP